MTYYVPDRVQNPETLEERVVRFGEPKAWYCPFCFVRVARKYDQYQDRAPRECPNCHARDVDETEEKEAGNG
jgi:rubrerythrin